MRWENWSDTRWGSIGSRARLFVASLCIGVDSLVHQLATTGKDNDKYYIGAANKRMTLAVKKYMVIACTCTFPAEYFVNRLLEDDRFVRHANALWQGILAECQYVCEIPLTTWTRLAALLDCPSLPAHTLRHEALCSMWTSIGYIRTEGYSQLQHGALRFTQGESIADTVAALARLDPSELNDPLSRKVHFCATFDPAECEAALRLLLDVPCSTGLVEKGHSAGALTKKFHHGLQTPTLITRAFLHEVRTLVRPNKVETQIMQAEENIGKVLGSSRHVRYSAQNAFAADLIHMANATAQATRAGPAQENNKCIAKHNRLFDGLDGDMRAMYAQIAQRRKAAKAAKIRQDALLLAGEVVVLKQRRDAELQESGACFKLFVCGCCICFASLCIS